MATVIVIFISLLIGASVLLFTYSVVKLKRDVPVEEREYMDPLPLALRLAWPAVRFLEFHVCAYIPADYLERANERLQLTGVGYLINSEQYYAIRIVSVLAIVGLAWFSMNALGNFDPTMMLLAVIGGFFLPVLWLRDVRIRRDKAVLKALPTYLDFITMAVEAGLNLTGAINQAMDKGPAGPLRHEFYMVVRDLRAGLPRSEALRRMEKRMGLLEITSFVGTVIQAEKMGARLGEALRIQAEQRRTERFQRAEKLAMEAPVKLIGPLLLFIFPVTFIVLGFPIAMKFIGQGIL